MDKAAPRGLWAFVVVVDVCALAALLAMPATSLTEAPGTVPLLIALTALAGTHPVRVPSFKIQFTATHPFIFCALAVAGPLPAALVAMAGILGGSFGKQARPSRQGMHLAFNLGSIVVSAAVTSVVFLALGGVPGGDVISLIWPLTAATAVFFITNTGLVTIIIALDKGLPIFPTWTKTFRWTTVSYLAGTTLAIGLLLILQNLGPWGLALGIPPTWLIAAFYRANMEKVEEHQARVGEVEKLNADLERRVESRTLDLQQALAQIEELQSLKATLTQTLVHDLKNPLSAVAGNLDLLEMQNDNERVLRLVRRSRAGADRLMRMIMDLMDIARMEEGRFGLSLESVDPLQPVRRALENAEASFEQQDVTLAIKPSDAPCSVRADRAVLLRVLDNLLANALRYSPKSGTVTVSIRPFGQAVEIGVADQGEGIPPQYREKVFEKYAQVELREAGLSVNRGLGLTFCQLAVEAHGGSIEAAEAPGGGALFRFTLPSAAAPLPRVPAGERDAPARSDEEVAAGASTKDASALARSD